MDYQQEYIPHAYVELRIPSGHGSTPSEPQFLLDPTGLHIWPRHSFMLIALPNKVYIRRSCILSRLISFFVATVKIRLLGYAQDGSFTCTLFAPLAELAPLRDQQSIIQWFQRHFPDAVELIGEAKLISDLTHNPRSPLISIKVC